MNHSPAKQGRILIIDDEPTNLAVLFQYLDQHGYEVFVAENGKSGLGRIQPARPDIILLDVLMPGIDGFETCQRLKENAETRSIPVIFMTALSDTAHKVKGFQVGAVDFVTKPFQYEELLMRLKTHLTIVNLQRELQQRNTFLEQEITQRKHAEQKLQAYAAKLKQSNQELQEFAYIASHDLQEPLRKVLTFGDRLQTKYGQYLDDQGRDYLNRMHAAAIRMQRLIHDLLKFSRVTTKAQPFVEVDLGQIAREVLTDLEISLQEVGGRVDLNDLPTVEADPIQMRQLFQNLLSNALKFHRIGATPLVRVQGHATMLPEENGANGKFCQITVSDNGIGFDEKHSSRIFQIFQRLHGCSEYEGTGIGLATCRKIVDRHGGSITAQSSPGAGATFVVTLPRTQPKTGVLTDQ
ncbi:MAG TPA: response regulator [Anaerolineae bacterium]|nr:response regulator [Anaerolineae bacterium]